MTLSGISSITSSSSGQSVLQSANQQPELAGELIGRTVESLSRSTETAQLPRQAVQSVARTSAGDLPQVSIDIRV